MECNVNIEVKAATECSGQESYATSDVWQYSSGDSDHFGASGLKREVLHYCRLIAGI